MDLRDIIIEKTIELGKIPSIKSNSLDKMPFGKDIDIALDYYLDLAKSLGFETYKDENGYFGYVDIYPQEEMFGILGHIDVVDVGLLENWTITTPFEPIVLDNKLYGRGIEDMKLPMITVLYVLKELVEDNVAFNKGIRIIVGTDEENEFRCMKEYEKHFEFPEYGFTPDGSFPVVNVEGSLIEYTVLSKEKSNFKVMGGSDFNTVADYAYYIGNRCLDLIKDLEKNNANYDYIKEENKVIVHGKAVHVMEINNGVNAINILCQSLNNINETNKMIKYISEQYKLETNGYSMLGTITDKFVGDLCVNIGKIDINENESKIDVDLRIPVLTDANILIEIIKNIVYLYDLEYIEYFNDTKVFVDENSPMVQLFLNVYNNITDTDGSCISSLGGSYSKVSPNYVGFGMNFRQLNQADTAHQANEFYDLNFLDMAINIYYDALREIIK